MAWSTRRTIKYPIAAIPLVELLRLRAEEEHYRQQAKKRDRLRCPVCSTQVKQPSRGEYFICPNCHNQWW